MPALLAVLTLSACETVKSARHDLQSVGATISTEAAKPQSSM